MRPHSVLLSASAMAVLMVVAAPCSAQPPVDSGNTRLAWNRGALDRGTFTVGGSLGYGYFRDFEKTVGDQPNIVDVSGDNGAMQWGGFLEYRMPLKMPVIAGLNVTYGTQDFSQTVQPPVTQTPAMVDGSITGWFVDLYLSYAIATRYFGMRFKGGCSHTTDKLSSVTRFGDVARDFDDTHSGFKTVLGYGLDYPITRRTALRASADYITGFKSGDADAHTRLSLGITRNFNF